MDPASQIRRAARERGDATAVIVADQALTYGELFARATRLANGLHDLGVRPGDRVAMLGDNSIETLEQVAACALGNHVRVTLYTYHSAEVNRYLLKLTGTRAILVQRRYLALLAPLIADLPDLVVVAFGGNEGTAADEAHHDYETLLRDASDRPIVVPCSPDDVHIIRFSSGTTGRPKAICHSIHQWRSYNDEWRWVTPLVTTRSTYLVPGSIAHLGIAFLWQFLAVGGRIVLMPSFDPGEALRAIEKYEVTHTAMAPVMVKDLLEHQDARHRDLSSLACLMYAGSPIATATLRRAVDVFGPVLYQLYAQSEVMPVTVLQPHEHVLDGTSEETGRLRSAGRATPHVVLTVRDDAGAELGPGQVGEVAAWSPGQMTGFWNDPEAESSRLLPDGSILTRDMGYLDERGYLFLVDRKDDMIVSGGFNIWPSELEDALAAHPAVADVCVVGVPSDRWGETPHALVVVRNEATDHEMLERELVALTRDRLGSVKKITSLEFVDDLPRSGAGKLLRSQIKARFWGTDGVRIGGS